jgi:hypothetical protein
MSKTKRIAHRPGFEFCLKLPRQPAAGRLATPATGECVAAFTLLSRLQVICTGSMRECEREAADLIAQLYATGMSERKIAAEIGRSDTWVHFLRNWAARGFEGTPFGPKSKKARDAASSGKQAEAADNVVPFPKSEPDSDDARREKENADADAHAAGLIKLIGPKHAGLAFDFLDPILRQNPFMVLKIMRAGKQRVLLAEHERHMRLEGKVTRGRR